MKRLITMTSRVVVLWVLSSTLSLAQIVQFSGAPEVPGSITQGVSNISTSYALANFVKSLSSFQGPSGSAWPASLNANNYPVNGVLSNGGNIFGVVYTPFTSVQFVTEWTGTATKATGAIQLNRGAPGFTIVSDPGSCVQGGTGFVLNLSGTNCRVVWTYTAPLSAGPAGLTLSFIDGSTFTNLSNLIICRVSDEAAVLANQNAWNPDFVASMKQLNPRVVRTLTFNDVNDGNNLSLWIYRSPLTALTFNSARWDPGAWAGSASCPQSGGTCTSDTYTSGAAPNTPGSWTDKEEIQVQFLYANATTTPTLNVNGRGAKTIVTMSGGPLAAGTIPTGSVGTLIYDVTSNELWLSGQQGGAGSGGILALMPPELLVSLANTLNMSWWYNFPHWAENAYFTNTAAYAAANLNSDLTWYPELSNEVWNNAAGFQQTSYANAIGTLLGFPADNNRPTYGWYALRLRQAMGMITAAWAPRSMANLKRVLAFQAFGPTVATQTYRMNGADLSAYSDAFCGSNYATSPCRPVDYADVFAYANYVSGAQLRNFDVSYTSNGGNSVFMGTISGTALTVQSVTSGTIAIGQGVAGASVTANSVIVSGSGTSWVLSQSSTVGSSEAMTGNTIANLLQQADNYTTGTPVQQSAAIQFVDTDLRSGTESTGADWGQTMADLVSVYSSWETVASSYPKFVQLYEGMYEGFYPSASTCTTLQISSDYCGSAGEIAALQNAYKASDYFRNAMIACFKQATANAHSRGAAWLLTTGNINSISQWALWPGDLYSTPAFRSWDAVLDFNSSGTSLQ